MHVILLNHKNGATNSLNVNLWLIVGVVVALLMLFSAFGAYVGMRYFSDTVIIDEWRLTRVLDKQQKEIELAKDEAQKHLDALTAHIVEIHSRLTRIDALGERLVSIAEIDGERFDFASPVGVGGDEPQTQDDVYEKPKFLEELNKLLESVKRKEKQLEYLEKFLGNKRLNEDAYIAGYPVKHGYISSHFGRRIHPITGKATIHSGIDFAARLGTPIIAPASGVVTFSGVKGGYGNTVEVTHSNGYVTLYAHNSENKVKVGDLVQRGQTIALVGTTGNSTGYHLHFEVKKDGRLENPMVLIQETKNIKSDNIVRELRAEIR